jgi:hypothetical protein
MKDSLRLEEVFPVSPEAAHYPRQRLFLTMDNQEVLHCIGPAVKAVYEERRLCGLVQVNARFER